jgi:hypothetical protein
MDPGSEILGNPNNQSHFFAVGQAQGDHPRDQLLAQGVDQLAKAFAVHITDLGGHYFYALDVRRFGHQFVQLAESAFAFLRLQFLLQGLHGGRHFLDCGQQRVFAYVQVAGDLGQNLGLFLEVFESANSGDGFDAANAGSDGLFADDLQYPDITDAVDVRAAAQFLGVEAAWSPVIRNGDYTNVALRVFVSEKGQRAGGKCRIEGSHVCFDGGVQANLVIDLLLDVSQLFRVQRRKVGKIET